ncbi:MAG: molybdopterin molybdotransferase MoeA [Hyphomicrobiales bacterium]|nr:molybdopterin molybdotransferase MoeA [Hyphomicrobiales bacterium]
MIDGLIPATDALQIILRDAAPQTSEFIKLRQANGRVLKSDLNALRTQPPFDASAMDGYAVRQQDIANIPARLKVIGQSAAGHPYRGSIGNNEAIRIFTGAPVPDQTDTIIIQEHTRADGGHVNILKGNNPGKFIRQAGLDFREGECLLQSGRVIDPQSISLAASMNHPQLEVWKKPVAAVLATGDELVMPGNSLAQGEIIASNSFALASIVEDAGGEALDMGIAKDKVESLIEHVQSAINQGADMIITIGGASVGDHDLVLPAMQKIGFEFEFSKIAMRPGKPFLFAKNQSTGKTIRMLGLAGNPVSSIIAGQIFVRPLVNAMAGLPEAYSKPQQAILGCDLKANDERQEYMRVLIKVDDNGTLIATPFETQDSSMLANLNRADALLIRAVNAPAASSGEACEIVLLK